MGIALCGDEDDQHAHDDALLRPAVLLLQNHLGLLAAPGMVWDGEGSSAGGKDGNGGIERSGGGSTLRFGGRDGRARGRVG